MLDTQLTYLESTGLIRVAQLMPELEYLFRHALVQDAAYESLLKQDRRHLHQVVGEALEGLYPDRHKELAATLGYHFLEAGDSARALQYLTAAADHALSIYAHPEAERHYRAALKLASQAQQQVALLTGLGEALGLQSRLDEAIVQWRQAIDLSLADGDLERAAYLYARIGWAMWYLGNTVELNGLADQGLQAVEGAADSVGLAALLHEKGRAELFLGRSQAAIPILERSLMMARATGAVETQAQTFTTLGTAFAYIGETDKAVELLQQAADLADSNGLLGAASRAHNNLGWTLGEIGGDWEPAREHFLKAAERNHQLGFFAGEMFNRANAAQMALSRGDLATADADLQPIRDQLHRLADHGPAIGIYLIVQGKLLRYQGRLEEALELFQRLHELMQDSSDAQFTAEAANGVSEILIELEQFDEAYMVLEPALDTLDDGMYRLLSACFMTMVLARQGKCEAAREMLESVQHIVATNPSAWFTAYYPLTQAVLLDAEGRLDESLAAYEMATLGFESKKMCWYRARSLHDTAALLIQRGNDGDHQRAHALLHDARSEFAAMGIAYYTTQIDDQLATLRAATLA